MKKNTSNDLTVEYSSGNVFADLGLDNADELLVKADFTREIRSTESVEVSAWTGDARRAAGNPGLARPAWP